VLFVEASFFGLVLSLLLSHFVRFDGLRHPFDVLKRHFEI
jgi:hypothetical protein